MDSIDVVRLPEPSGMSEGWPQKYEISVVPERGTAKPMLPFLHKEDGFALEDGTRYWVESATQRLVKTETGTVVHWIYTVTKDRSGEDQSDEGYGLFGASRFGR